MLRSSLRAAISFAALALACPTIAQEKAIRVGDINSYSALPQGRDAYKNGMQLAVNEINAAGLIGRKLEVLSRDDAGKPDVATRQAQELVTSEKVDLLTGTILSHISLAVADYAARRKIFFLATEPLTDAIVGEKGNRYTFRLRASTATLARMLVEEAAKLPAKRWATIAPNYEYGQSAVATFKAALKARRPDVEFIAEQWPALGKLEAASTVQALVAANPEAIFNVTFGADLARFVREGNLRDLFQNRQVVSLLTGEPEYLDPLKGEAPKGWIVTGYPWDQIRTPEHVRFVEAYRKKYNDYPRSGALMGYVNMHAIAEIIRKAASTDSEKLVAAASGLTFQSVLGPITFRPNGQSTMGAYVGRLDVKDGRGTMVNWRYVDGANFF